MSLDAPGPTAFTSKIVCKKMSVEGLEAPQQGIAIGLNAKHTRVVGVRGVIDIAAEAGHESAIEVALQVDGVAHAHSVRAEKIGATITEDRDKPVPRLIVSSRKGPRINTWSARASSGRK